VEATLPDLLRLLAVPVLGWAAYSDIKTRRVPNRTWYPLIALGIVLLIWDALALGFEGPRFNRFLFQTIIGVGVVSALVMGFWFIGSFGGADAKAFLTIAVLFPTYPVYEFFGLTVPAVVTDIGIFSLTILTNAFLVLAAYPLALAVANARSGKLSLLAFIARRVSVPSLLERHGTILDTDNSFTRSGVDLDALRMYLNWRQIDLETLQSSPDLENHDGPIDDPWEAKAFLDDIETSAYNTAPEDLRAGIDRIVETEKVWVSPGIPFIVPTFFGLLLALTAGDVLFLVLEVLGIVG